MITVIGQSIINSTLHKKSCDCGHEVYGEHSFNKYVPFDNECHKVSCSLCGEYTFGEHVIDASSPLARYRPCKFCRTMVDTGETYFPIIKDKIEDEELQ